VNHFNRADGSRWILRVDIHQDNFCPLIENLPQHRVTRPYGKAKVAEDSAGHVGAFNPGVQNDGLFTVLGEDGDGYPMHESILALQGHATNFLHRGQMTFVIEGDHKADLLAGGDAIPNQNS
jgi:hypothetical protein